MSQTIAHLFHIFRFLFNFQSLLFISFFFYVCKIHTSAHLSELITTWQRNDSNFFYKIRRCYLNILILSCQRLIGIVFFFFWDFCGCLTITHTAADRSTSCVFATSRRFKDKRILRSVSICRKASKVGGVQRAPSATPLFLWTFNRSQLAPAWLPRIRLQFILASLTRLCACSPRPRAWARASHAHPRHLFVVISFRGSRGDRCCAPKMNLRRKPRIQRKRKKNDTLAEACEHEL